ncbi:hypothetical protein OG21DRAFT_1411149, partial [Imleria badia]
KCKHSMQDSSVNLPKMNTVLNCLEALKEGLEELHGTRMEEMDELQTALDHVVVMKNILKDARKPRVSVSADNLKKAGIMRKQLVFQPQKVTELTKGLSMSAESKIVDLHAQIKKIYAYVNMDIASTQMRGIVIIPEMRIAKGDGVSISHPISGYELWLCGKANYAVVEYEDVMDNKDRVLGPGGSRQDTFDLLQGCLLLVEAKYQSPEETIVSFIPEAVSQATTLLRSTKHALENSDLQLREIVQLLCEWLKPTMTDLFTLK